VSEGRDAILGATGEGELRRAYAECLASTAGSDPWEVAALRSAFRFRRRELELRTGREVGDEDLGTSTERWFAACFDRNVGREALEEALPRLENPRFRSMSSGRARRLLDAREDWFDALGDPEIPDALLELYRARHLDRKRPLDDLESIPGARAGAVAMRARYPALAAADPGVLKALLAPKLGEKLGSEVQLAGRGFRNRAGVGITVVIVLIFAALRFLRHCDAFDDEEPKPDATGRPPAEAPADPPIGIGGGD